MFYSHNYNSADPVLTHEQGKLGAELSEILLQRPPVIDVDNGGGLSLLIFCCPES